MRVKDAPESRYSPTDPSLEFDILEIVRTRLVDALKERGYDLLGAEKIALYTTEGVRCIPKFMKVMTRAEPAKTEEIIEALGRMLDETPALEKAKRLLLRQEDAEPEEIENNK
jgi:hypothetical protein